MLTLDKGHRYQLVCLDGDETLILQFVKRQGANYPGNVGEYPGTNLQSVWRACIARLRYLQGQKRCLETGLAIFLLQACNWLLEFRAARRHGVPYWHGLTWAEKSRECQLCGHTFCKH